jgi:Na+:H+ antiporter, NhaA family
VGLELKREIVAGDLSDPGTAVVPVAAAVGGVIVPALIYVAINWHDQDAVRGWAVPTATDIAFAVAVLAVIGSHLPSALRLFLLTLAVADDLIAIVIIAFFYTTSIQMLPLVLTLVPLALYTFLAQKYRKFFRLNASAAWFVLLPIGIATWVLLHASGVHSTVAGVLLGFAVPVLRVAGSENETGPGLAELFEHRFRPISTGFAVPVFAFFAAGVAIGGWDGFVAAFGSPVTLGVLAALVLGKPIGIVAMTWLTTRLTRAELDPSVKWIDLTGVAFLGGIGFTVSLLVAELSFGAGSTHDDDAKVAILVASLAAAFLASLVLRARNRHYRRIEFEDAVDADGDGIPDVYQQ